MKKLQNKIEKIIINIEQKLPYISELEIKQLLKIIRFIEDNKIYIELSIDITHINEFIENNKNKLLDDIVLLHLWYSISILNNFDNQNIKKQYFFLISKFNKISELHEKFYFIYLVYDQNRLTEYINGIAYYLFDQNFWKLNITEQMIIIYKFFYIIIQKYERGKEFKLIYNILKVIYNQALKDNNIDLIMYLYTPLQFSWNGVSSTQKEFKKYNKEIEKPLEKFIKNKLISKYNLKPNKRKIKKNQKKIKIVFLQERIINYSINNVFYSLIKALSKIQQNKYEFIIMDLNYKELGGSLEKEVAKYKKFRKYDIQYIDCHKKFVGNDSPVYSISEKVLKIRKWLIKNKIDILIGMHSRAEYNFLFTTRTCPKQYYWSHGNCEYDIKEIDKKISHFPQLCKDKKFEIFNILIDKKILIGSKLEKEEGLEIKKEYLKQFGKNTIILGTIGRLVKLDNDKYIEIVSKLMKKNPNVIYLACGSGDQNNIKNKLIKYNIDIKRFIFTGHVNPHIYGWVIDIWINTYPFSQGESQEEYHAKNNYVIQGEFLINCKEKNDYERIYNNFLKNRPDFFYKVFEIDPKKIKKSVSYDRLRFRIYKKYNKNINKKNIIKCINYVEKADGCKEKWERILDCIIKNKSYFKMHKWIVTRLWKANRKYKNYKNPNFIDIIKN